MTPYEVVKTTFLIFVVACIGLLMGHALPAVDELRWDGAVVSGSAVKTASSLQTALTAVQGIELNTTRTEAEMAGLLNQTRHSMLTAAQTQELVARTETLLDNSNLALVGLRQRIDELQGIAPAAQGAISQVTQDAHTTLQAGQAMMQAATSDLDDPAGKQILAHVNASALNVEGTTADLKKEADIWVAPVKGFWNHVKILLMEAIGPLAEVATAVK